MKKPKIRRTRLRNERFTALHDSFQAHWMLVIWGSYTETRFDYTPTQAEPLPPRHTKRRRFLSFVRREATTAYRISDAKNCWVLMKEYGPLNHCAFWAQVPGIVGTTEYEAVQHHAADGNAVPQRFNIALGYRGPVAARVPWRLYQERLL